VTGGKGGREGQRSKKEKGAGDHKLTNTTTSTRNSWAPDKGVLSGWKKQPGKLTAGPRTEQGQFIFTRGFATSKGRRVKETADSPEKRKNPITSQQKREKKKKQLGQTQKNVCQLKFGKRTSPTGGKDCSAQKSGKKRKESPEGRA